MKSSAFRGFLNLCDISHAVKRRKKKDTAFGGMRAHLRLFEPQMPPHKCGARRGAGGAAK